MTQNFNLSKHIFLSLPYFFSLGNWFSFHYCALNLESYRLSWGAPWCLEAVCRRTLYRSHWFQPSFYRCSNRSLRMYEVLLELSQFVSEWWPQEKTWMPSITLSHTFPWSININVRCKGCVRNALNSMSWRCNWRRRKWQENVMVVLTHMCLALLFHSPLRAVFWELQEEQQLSSPLHLRCLVLSWGKNFPPRKTKKPCLTRQVL